MTQQTDREQEIKDCKQVRQIKNRKTRRAVQAQLSTVKGKIS